MKLLLLGGNGQVGWELRRSVSTLGQVVELSRDELDLARPDSVSDAVSKLNPDVIINAAAYTAVDRAESESDLAYAVNASSVQALADVAADRGSWLVHYSTDYVFDGSRELPLKETDSPNPLNVYGRSKLEGEIAIAKSGCRHLIFRTSWVHASRRSNFIRTIMKLIRERDKIRVVSDQIGAPTGADLIADVTAIALRQAMSATNDTAVGVYHLTASGHTNWYDYARFVLSQMIASGCASLDSAAKLEPISTADYPTLARRPLNSRLDTSRLKHTFGVELPDWRQGVARSFIEMNGEL